MNLFKKYLVIVESNNKRILNESNENNINDDFNDIIKFINEIDQTKQINDVQKSIGSIKFYVEEIFLYVKKDFQSNYNFTEKYFDNFNKDLTNILTLIDNKIKNIPKFKTQLSKLIKEIIIMYIELFEFFFEILDSRKYNETLMKELYKTYAVTGRDIISALSDYQYKFAISNFAKYHNNISFELPGLQLAIASKYLDNRKGKETEEEEIENINRQKYIDDIDEYVTKHMKKTYEEISSEINDFILKIKNSLKSKFFSDKELYSASINKKTKDEVNSEFREILSNLLETLSLFDQLVTRHEFDRENKEKERNMKEEKKKIQTIIDNLLFMLSEKAFFSKATIKVIEIIENFNDTQLDDEFHFEIKSF